jgi:hypothetical protein
LLGHIGYFILPCIEVQKVNTLRKGKMRFHILLLAGLSLCGAFAPKHLVPRAQKISPSNLNLAEITGDVEAARGLFYFWFFGSSGAAGVARSAFPRMYDQVTYIRSLKGVGPTLGGETLGVSPICGYPEDLAIKDVENVANNPLNVGEIVAKYPIEGNFLSKKGYLTFAAFEQANKDANPLAVRAIFDTFAQSTNCCSPEIAQGKLDLYKIDLSSINGALLKSKATGFASIAALLFLLGFADFIAAGHAYHGWFPDWPGANNFPACFFDPETSPLRIPDYWI